MNTIKNYAKNIFDHMLEYKDTFATATGNLNGHRHV
ncbi:Uncharacterised protein [Corynebacterium pilosum]|uniref:Uncharacterized protein n=1 Tax=Corynebacterium pilosum TaxID=35756 RepID=A0A376CJU2_9CORY|nr:Uncharacterised protein [Corynebacterium pilosum]